MGVAEECHTPSPSIAQEGTRAMSQASILYMAETQLLVHLGLQRSPSTTHNHITTSPTTALYTISPATSGLQTTHRLSHPIQSSRTNPSQLPTNPPAPASPTRHLRRTGCLNMTPI